LTTNYNSYHTLSVVSMTEQAAGTSLWNSYHTQHPHTYDNDAARQITECRWYSQSI